MRRQWNNGFQVQKEKAVNIEFYSKNIFQKRRQDKDVFRHTKPGRIHHQLTCTTRNVKGHTSSRLKMVSVGNLELHKGMKINRNGNYIDNIKGFFFLLFKNIFLLFKRSLYKQK